MTGSTDSGTGSWVSEFTDFTNSPKDYTFTKDNPLVDLPDPLDEGRKRLSAGDLPSAVLCFEAAVTKEPDNPLAWQLLGSTQAENEQDPQAISALRKCLQIEPNNLTALMSLAVCFTNENYQSQACKVLKEWLRANPKYTDLVPSSENDFESAFLGLSLMTGIFCIRELHDQVKGMYLEAARRNPTETIDADVQCGLGVLFNLSSETDRAVDCFKVALQARPDDAALWNRLGATLANGSRSEEAIDAYRNALQLSPGFIRARYNLGISCVHLGAHREAAEHLLTALNQQAAGRGVQGEKYTAMSDTIWTTLRLVTSILERPDLVSVINSR
ncbi:hypothetical protein AAG570_006165 [Ranatra chinensis]|uniref:Peroxin-5 n=1 Tax=Ranatra chinensis TaxID=642074 RepID=A0ABD0XX92_9HEMI